MCVDTQNNLLDTYIPINVPVSVIMDQDVECIGVALCAPYEAVNLCLCAVIHLDHVALGLPLRDTLLVYSPQDA